MANLPFTVLVTGAFFDLRSSLLTLGSLNKFPLLSLNRSLGDGGLLNVDGVGFLGSLLLLLPSWVVAQRNIVSFCAVMGKRIG